MVNDFVDFAMLKEHLEITDGNLASHINALEKINYIEIKKQFFGKKPNTSYVATAEGKLAFSQHLDALEKLIRNSSWFFLFFNFEMQSTSKSEMLIY